MSRLTLDEYTVGALRTAVFPKEQDVEYCGLGLASEAGEVAGKIKKMIRDNSGVLTPEIADGIRKEIGGTLWYAALLSDALNSYLDEDDQKTLGEIAQQNLDILADRKARGVIHGSGDER